MADALAILILRRSSTQIEENRGRTFRNHHLENFHFAIASVAVCLSMTGPESIAVSAADPSLPTVK